MKPTDHRERGGPAMSGDLGFYIEMLERAGDRAGNVGDTLYTIASRLRDGTASLDGAWGDDRYGEQFAQAYVPVRNALVMGDGGKSGALPDLANVFSQIGDAEKDGAKALRQQENHNTAQFR
jgi:hypothetical protein